MTNEIAATLECTSGAHISEKLETAFEKCHNIYDFSRFHAWDGNKSSNFLNMVNSRDGCQTYKEIMEWLYSEYSTDICILQNINWLDHNFNINEDIIDNDIASVPNEFQLVSVDR